MGDVLRDLTGNKFNRWTVLERGADSKGGQTRWLCKCECGKMKLVQAHSLICGASKSCGCLVKELHAHTHLMTKTKLYRIWQRMKGCTSSKSHQDYKHYGGRGITVCNNWKNDFLNFHKWSMENGYKEGLSIDRIDVNGNYEPSNCRWVTISEQQHNKRNTIKLSCGGETHSLVEWCKIKNICYSTLYGRLYQYNYPVEKALNMEDS